MGPERTAISYGPSITAASRSVLLEVMTVLRAYQDALILIGGWAPYYLLEFHREPGDGFVHVGSIDIDLVVDADKIGGPQYATIVELLTARGYRPAPDRRGQPIPSSFERTVAAPTTDKPYTIRVDFLAPLASGEPPRLPHEMRGGQARAGAAQVQEDLFARKVRGCEAALRHHEIIELTGALPGGGMLTVPVQMADLVSCLTMKGIVLGERFREKDAYDIHALAAHHRGGPRAVAEALRPHLGEPLVQEAMRRIQEAFQTRQGHGPAWVASFVSHPRFAQEYQRALTDAYMVMRELSEALLTERARA